jgi:hypothetical protein
MHVIKRLETDFDILLEPPANSPNLTLIEMLSIVVKKIATDMEPKTVEDLRIGVLIGWETMKQSTVYNLCTSFPSRLQM